MQKYLGLFANVLTFINIRNANSQNTRCWTVSIADFYDDLEFWLFLRIQFPSDSRRNFHFPN